MPDIVVAKPFTLTHAGEMRSFEPGEYKGVSEEIASHWYVRAHLVDPPPPAHEPGSHAAFMAAGQEAIAAQRAKADEARAKAAAEAAARAKEKPLEKAGVVRPFGKAAR